MTQIDLNRAVACATGESVSAIAKMGLGTLTTIPVERETMLVDWDQLDQQRVSVFPQRSRQQTVAA